MEILRQLIDFKKCCQSSPFHLDVVLRVWKETSESQSHLFAHCAYARKFWDVMLGAFDWSMTFPGNMHDLLATVFLSHPFEDKKKLLWLAIIRASLWNLLG